jgi:serpin B
VYPVVLALLAGCSSSSGPSSTSEDGGGGGGGGGDSAAPVDAWKKPADPERILKPAAPEANVTALVTANTAFAARLHQQVTKTAGNLFYSPYGVSLNMAELDSSGAQPAVAEVVGFPLSTDGNNAAFDALDLDLTSITGKTESGTGIQFQEATAAWGTLAGGKALQEYYGAETLGGKNPGQALQAWQTGASPGPALPVALVGPCDGFLATLLHLDAAWATGFDSSLTQPGPFKLADGKSVNVPIMNLEVTLPAQLTGATKAVELPYDGGRLAMLVVVPTDLATFESTLSPATLGAVISSLEMTDVQLGLPKFSLTYPWNVLEVLSNMGVKLTGGGMWAIAQTSEVDVSEVGTQATSTTVTSHGPTAVARGAPFTVDQPFDFFIRDQKTGSVLFAGRIADPSQAQ